MTSRFALKGRMAKITGGASAFPLLVLFGLNTVDELDRAAFQVLLPNIRDSFGLSISGVLAVQAFVEPVAIGLGLFVAFFADRGRRTRIAALGGAVWAVFSVLTGFAVNILALGLARIGAALGKSVNQPTHNSLLSDYYPTDVRATIYAFHGAANPLGLMLGPLGAGAIALYFSWRVPFMLAAIPTIVLVFFALGLKEPKRGVQDRLALGAVQEDAETEETPPTLAEAFRILFAVKSLRRIYTALPFIGAGAAGAGSLLSLFWADVYHLNELQRGVIASASQPVALIGLAVFAPLSQRLMNRDPALALRLLGLSSIVTAGSYALIAFSPNVWVAIVGALAQTAVLAALLPGVYAIFSVVIPAKVRSLGFISGLVFAAPGAFVLVFVGAIGDAFGLRIGILVMIPLYVGGFLVIASAGKFLRDDIQTVRVQSMAEQEVRKALEEGEPKLLLMRDLDVGYDQVQVIFGVDIEMAPGEIIALLGTNGAGKSTLLRAISGQTDPMSGAIYFNGVDITHIDPLGTFAMGIVQMPGGRAVFPSLTVEEHLQLSGWSLKDDPEHVARATAEVLEIFPRLQERWDQPAGNLSGGEQQMLALSMALIAKPKLLMIDELSLGLAPTIVSQLLDVIRRINAQGTAVLIVEQSVNVALTIADRAYFLEKGEVRFSGPTAELLDRGDILRAVFLEGAGLTKGSAKTNGKTNGKVPARARVIDRSATPSLEVRGITRSFGGICAVNDVSFAVAPNEILGLIGPNGAGKTTIFDLVSGFVDVDEGAILLGGTDITRLAPDARARLGLGRSFQDARIFGSLTVAENLAVAMERHLSIRDHLADALALPAVSEQELDIRFSVDELIELMNLEAFRNKFVSELSTGSRRIADLAMAIAHDPSVLILDEPSSGIAQREAEALGPLIQRIQREVGCSVLVIEHDMALVMGISDRMLALELGAVVTEGTPEEVIRNPQVVSAYLGGDLATINRSGTAAKSTKRSTTRKASTRA
ncbi:MAG: hypothetical protein QOI61_660 [Actinomycetota bacterium]